MTCDHARCTSTATIALRFGDGTWTHGNRTRRQTYVRYCGPHVRHVHDMFVTCDEQPVRVLELGPAGGGIRMRR